MTNVQTTFIEYLANYWYIAIAVVLVLVVGVIALVAALSRWAKQVKENKQVNRGRKQDDAARRQKEQESKNRQTVLDEAAITADEEGEEAAAEDAALEETPTEEVVILAEEVPQNAQNSANKPLEESMKKETKEPIKKETAKKEPVKKEAPKKDVEEAAVESKTTKAIYRVIYDKENKEWMVKKDGASRVIRRVKTKAEALELATQFAENQDLGLSVQKKDGKFQKKTNYSKMISPKDDKK